jgi:transglutaminase-like putative cysteine protease
VKRREFLASVLATPVMLRNAAMGAAVSRTFEITTTISLAGATGAEKAWVPLPLARPTSYQRNLGHTIGGNAERARVVRDPDSGAEVVAAEWATTAAPALSVTMRVATTGPHAVRLDRPAAATARPSGLERYLKPTALIPTDGIVRETAMTITRGHRTGLSRARAIYEWIVEHTVRDPEVKGCGLGDIRWMLETKNLAGKCADLNALFVGLARASGLPARDLYGIRVAPSQQFASLGRAGGNITTAQHCRAEVFVDGYGWIPVDPADVRKLILEVRAQATLSDPYVARAREALFGSWEMNWIAFNDAHDVVLPGSTGKPLPFFMYPQAESGGVRRDSLDPDRFRYAITAREL